MTLLAGELLWTNSPWGAGLSASTVIALLVVSHLTLLSEEGRRSVSAIALRLSLLIITTYFVADLAYNLRYSFGSGFRDLACGTLSWHLFAKAIDVGLVFDIEGKPPPRWCVPDWDAESKKGEEEEGKKPDKRGPINGHSPADAANGGLPFWKRTPIGSRPQWAIESDYMPTHWRLSPLPSRLVDRLIWALDVLLMRRHGTSYLFPNDLRALEWSQKRLIRSGQAQEEFGRARLQKQKFAEVIPFGYSETPMLDAIIQTVAVGIFIDYFSKLDIPAASTPGGFYGLPLVQQILLTCSMGVPVSLTADLPELILFPLLQGWPFYTPCTAIVPTYRNVVRSKSLTDMWGYRWHTMARRDFARLGLLLPFGGSTPAVMVLKSFFWSAVFHSCIFLRHQPQPSIEAPWRVLHSFYLPGCFGLFLGQGLLVIAENALRPFIVRHRYYTWIKARSVPSCALSCLQSAYVYGTLIFMSRWVLAEMFHFNLLSSEETQTMKIQVQWADYTQFLMERYLAIVHSIGMR